MRQKGFAPIIILLILVVGALMGITYYFGTKGLNPSPSPIPTSDPTAGWETYSGDKYSFKHPSYKLLDDNPNHLVFGVNIPPSSNNLYPLLEIFSKLQLDYLALAPCPEWGGISPCLSDASEIKEIQVGSKSARIFYIDSQKYINNNLNIVKYHIVQIPSAQIEIRMDDTGGGRERIFNQILATFNFN